MPSDQELQDEWARMNQSGRVVNRQKTVAVVASVGATMAIVVGGYAIAFALWSDDHLPVFALAFPWFPGLPVGLWIRNRLWPKGALA